VLTSGASETVPDESEFARQFKSLLESNTEACLDPLAMYDRIRRGVTKTLPLLGTLPGHESGASYVLFLKGSGGAVATAALPVKTVFILTVDVSQKDTDVYVNGEWKGQTPLELSLQPGPIEVSLSGPFVRLWSTKAAGKAGEGLRLSPKLPALGAISLDAASLPSGVVVMLDGVAVKSSKLAGGLPTEPGTRTLRIEGPLYRTWETAVSVKAEELSVVKPALVFKTASIRMQGLPPEATVSVTGQVSTKSVSVGETALYRDLRLGDYAVTISHPLWTSAWSTKLKLVEEKDYELVAPTGWIELPRPPTGALVSLNGKRIETTTRGEREATPPLLAGTYRLEVSGTYLKSNQSDLVVEAGMPSLASLRYEEIGQLDLLGNPGLAVTVLGSEVPALPTRLGEGFRLALPGGSYTVKAKKGEDIDWPWSTSISVVPGSTVNFRIPPEAETWSFAWRIREEEASLASFKTDFDRGSASRKSRTTIGIAAFATGGLSAAAAGIFYFLGSQAMSAYQGSTATGDALAQRKIADLYNTLFFASASLSGAGIGIGGLALATTPTTASIERSVSESLERLARLKSEKAFAELEN
ncbi:MAG: PEGA domain-containing protein, partial [Spirochaetota bacterium]